MPGERFRAIGPWFFRTYLSKLSQLVISLAVYGREAVLNLFYVDHQILRMK